MSAHALFVVHMSSPIPPVGKQLNAFLETDKPGQLDHIMRPVSEWDCLQMPQNVKNAPLVRIILGTSNDRTFRAPVMSK